MAVTATTSPGIHLLNTNNADRINWQRGKKIEYKDEAKAPLMAYHERAGAQQSSDSDLIKLFRGDLMSRRYTLSDATGVATFAGSTAEDATISSVTDLVAGMVCLVHGGIASEGSTAGTLIYLDAVDTAATEINYTNLSGSAHAIVQNDELIPISFVSADDAETGPSFTDREPETVTGYLSILKFKTQITITERDTAIYAAEGREQEKIKRSRMEFMRHREAHAWFSMATTNVGSNKIRTSMGIWEQLQSGITMIDGGEATLSAAMLADAIANGAKYYDTTEFAVFHGNDGLAGLFQLGANKILTDVEDDAYGFKAQTIKVAQYRLAMVYSQLFDLVGEPFSSMMIGLDLSNITNWYKGGEGRMQLKKNTDPKAAAEGEVISHMWRVQEGTTLNVLERHFAIEALA